jgi:predicted acyltransferase (DUF342 family)
VFDDVSINGIVHINNKTIVDGDVSLNQNVTIQDKLNVFGDVSINKLLATDVSFTNLDVDGNLNVNNINYNNTSIQNTVILSSSIDISNAGTGPAIKITQYGTGDGDSVALFDAGSEGPALLINSAGKSTFYKDVSFNQNADISGTLDVSGTTTLRGLLKANGGIAVDSDKFTVADGTGNTSIAGTLDVTDVTTMTGLLNANGGIAVDSDKFTVDNTGNTSIKGTLGVTDDTIIDGNVGIGGSSTPTYKLLVTGSERVINNLDVSENVTIQEKLNVFNDVSINGIVRINNKTIVDGDVSLNQNVDIEGTLGVKGITTLSSDTNIGGNLDVTGDTTLRGQINSADQINGTLEINAGLKVKAGTSESKAFYTNLTDFGATFYVTMEGDLWSKTATTWSDTRLKHNKEDIEGLSVIRRLKPKKYNKTSTEDKNSNNYYQEAGFIAQDVLETDISWVVNESQTDTKYYGLNYNSVFTYGIQSIKELDEQFSLEKKKITLLQEQLENLILNIEKTKTEINSINKILGIV